MPSRKSSAHRPRERVAESTSTSEDAMAYKVISSRQTIPSVPPSNLRAQADQGFARFLKKHASPTHQRVTAGGRIVPMEARQSPPTFGLNSARKVPHNTVSSSSASVNSPSLHKTVSGAATNISGEHGDTQRNDGPHSQAFDSSDLSNSRIKFQPLACNSQPQDTLYAHQVSSHNTISAPSAPIVAFEPFRAIAQSTCMPMSSGSRGDQVAVNCPPNVSSQTASNWPSSEHRFPFWYDMQPSISDIINQQLLDAQKSLAYWTQCYEELDRQLKALDRQRAMSSLNHAMVMQRKEIIQQRSDTKDMINKIRAFLGMSEHATALNQQQTFNVNAAAYIPHSHHRTDSQTEDSIAPTPSPMGGDVIRPPGARRPIPIVAPEGQTTGRSSTSSETNTSVSANEVDGWGVQIGRAPPDLERQQSGLVEALAQSSPKVPGAYPDHSDIPLRVKSYSENDAYVSSIDDQISDPGTWDWSRPGRAPPTIEHDYELQLDAMRKPKGIRTNVRLHNGTVMTIEGSDLRPPNSRIMSDFEKEYWSRQPAENVFPGSSSNATSGPAVLTPSSSSEHHLHDFVRHDELIDKMYSSRPDVQRLQADNHADTAVVQASTRVAACSDQIDSRRMEDLHTPVDFDTQSLQDLRISQNARTRQILQDMYGNEKDNECNNVDKTAGEGNPRGLNAACWYVNTSHFGDPSSSLDENFDNKSFYSTSIQNVHAAAHGPYLDGSGDTGRTVQSLLNVAGKPQSPRFLQRVGRGSWFGALRRGHDSQLVNASISGASTHK